MIAEIKYVKKCFFKFYISFLIPSANLTLEETFKIINANREAREYLISGKVVNNFEQLVQNKDRISYFF